MEHEIIEMPKQQSLKQLFIQIVKEFRDFPSGNGPAVNNKGQFKDAGIRLAWKVVSRIIEIFYQKKTENKLYVIGKVVWFNGKRLVKFSSNPRIHQGWAAVVNEVNRLKELSPTTEFCIFTHVTGHLPIFNSIDTEIVYLTDDYGNQEPLVSKLADGELNNFIPAFISGRFVDNFGSITFAKRTQK